MKDKLDILLDSPIKLHCPRGVLVCISCGEISHHNLIYCPICGNKFVRQKEMTWRTLLKIKWNGRGMYNAFGHVCFVQKVDIKWEPIVIKIPLKSGGECSHYTHHSIILNERLKN